MVEDVLESYSMQLGCVRVTERALGKGVVDQAHHEAAVAMISEQLDAAWRAVPAFATLGDVRLIGLAGSVSTLVQLDAAMVTYQRELVHHKRISLATVYEWRDRLASEPPETRLARPGMIQGREDVSPRVSTCWPRSWSDSARRNCSRPRVTSLTASRRHSCPKVLVHRCL